MRGRLPVKDELDKKGIDLHSVLCLVCDNAYESIDHEIVLCSEVMKVCGIRAVIILGKKKVGQGIEIISRKAGLIIISQKAGLIINSGIAGLIKINSGEAGLIVNSGEADIVVISRKRT
ncbi:RNA-directed DNA polymerase, eukaryota, reverse transcriptase zinc-binding domain protein [Tanacetum coccineum]